MLDFSIGVSALQTAQQQLSVAGNNLANASTPGYHRQVADVVELGSTIRGNLSVGGGVGITGINRAVSEQLDAAVTQQTSVTGYTDASLASSTQIEQAVSTGVTSPSTELEALLNKLQALSSKPSDGASQRAAVTSASSVATAFNTTASDLSQLKTSLDLSINGDVTQINSLASQIANLNSQIVKVTNQGVSPNDLLDQRGKLVNDLAKITNIQVQNGDNGQISVTASGVALAIGNVSQTLVAGTDPFGAATITVKGLSNTVSITGGDLGGLLSQRNGTLADFQSRLDTLARQVAKSFNTIQSTGVGSSGGFSQLTSQNSVSSGSANLSAAGLSIAPQSGSLFVGVTNTSTGQRTITEVTINPKTQSLNDVATSITNTVPNLQAFVSGQNGTLSLIASTGYTFDFTGGIQANPTTNFAGGSTTTATVGGAYKGSTNDNYTVTFSPPGGTVGVTPNLQAVVTNQAGATVATLNVGQGYQAGQPLEVAKGVTVSLGAGVLSAGDSFVTPVIGNPDSAGLLTSLGLNTLFSGNDAASLKVSSAITTNPALLATSRTGASGDTSNLQRFTALRDASVLNYGSQTFSQYANQMVSDIGTEVSTLTSQQDTNATLTTSLSNQQQSISGVDTNEELSNVLQYQQQFEAASKYISAVNDMVKTLIQAVN